MIKAHDPKNNVVTPSLSPGASVPFGMVSLLLLFL